VNHNRTKRMSRSSRVRRTNSCCRSMLAMIQSARFHRVTTTPACPFLAADTRTEARTAARVLLDMPRRESSVPPARPSPPGRSGRPS
jgi:hypothetical protein